MKWRFCLKRSWLEFDNFEPNNKMKIVVFPFFERENVGVKFVDLIFLVQESTASEVEDPR